MNYDLRQLRLQILQMRMTHESPKRHMKSSIVQLRMNGDAESTVKDKSLQVES